ncbi:peptide/nickel transport system substrate-binding protein [Arboricoccus pini]|uniref:Peptide/nickel transport system substrate-binding protein n=1 Tax=Arboricoccus pini TaxID=1963835 RepID=A0A212QY94_9PROT|nr:ABC transporter substrate-binding protein [Arboricoccus pini]SNB64546.1 peptide/nickel transport system substrate-binding protein [Arboricoccus pini]
MISRRLALQATGASLLGGALFGFRPAQARKRKVLRAAMLNELRSLDPVQSGSYATRNHAYMIYDTLFAMDADGHIQPQMVERYEVSEDGLVYRFTLREGLLFHDDRPVTAADAVASIRRWAARDTLGQMLLRAVRRMTVLDSVSFEIVLERRFGLVLHALGGPSTRVLFIMPERLAETPPDQAVAEQVGSGPFTFDAARWKPGTIAVYDRFAGYSPRPEAPSWEAGGKVVHLDRVECVFAADPQSAVNALLAGELDMIEQPPIDQLDVLKDDAETVLLEQNALGNQLFLRFNPLWPPFADPRLRQAAIACLNQEDFLKSAIGDPLYYESCPAMFVCDTPLATPEGGVSLLKSDFERCKRLLREVGYAGAPIVLLHPLDQPVLSQLAPVARQLLERGGFKVQMVPLGWQAYLDRRHSKAAPTAGGWSIFLGTANSVDALDPISTATLNATGETGYDGWFDDPRLEEMKRRFVEAPDLAAEQEQARAIQLYALQELGTHAYLGQYKLPMAIHQRLSGVLPGTAPHFWNIDKVA